MKEVIQEIKRTMNGGHSTYLDTLADPDGRVRGVLPGENSNGVSKGKYDLGATLERPPAKLMRELY
ncbi:hypothetical protein ACFL1B_01880 [Nanoarchaeota archaeon]